MSNYFRTRPEIIELIPEAARHVLDIGCGEGHIGEALKRERPGVEVRGVEVNHEAASIARERLDAVVVGDDANAIPSEWPSADCAVFADVLEHMVDPWQGLAQYCTKLGRNTTFVFSLPNVAHFEVIQDLRRGLFRYVDQGILDKTHLRFFTRFSLVELIEGAGLKIVYLRRRHSFPHPPLLRWSAKAVTFHLRRLERRRGVPRAGRSLLDRYTYQYLVVARPR